MEKRNLEGEIYTTCEGLYSCGSGGGAVRPVRGVVLPRGVAVALSLRCGFAAILSSRRDPARAAPALGSTSTARCAGMLGHVDKGALLPVDNRESALSH